MLNKKNILLMLLFILFTFNNAYSQNSNKFGRGKGRISGIIKNEAGEPIKGALVVLIHEDGITKFVSKSNKKGAWRIVGLGTGEHKITVSYKGYQQCVKIRRVYQLKRNPKVICILKKKEKPEKDEFSIRLKQISHKAGSSIGVNEKVYVLFDYNIPKDYNDGVYIYAIPTRAKRYNLKINNIHGDLQVSKFIIKKKGVLTRYFSVKSGDTLIRKVNILMMDKSRDKVLATLLIPVNYLTYPNKGDIKTSFKYTNRGSN